MLLIKKTSNAIYIATFKETEEYLANNIKSNDIVLTMGAGNVYLIGESLLNNSTKINKEKAAVWKLKTYEKWTYPP